MRAVARLRGCGEAARLWHGTHCREAGRSQPAGFQPHSQSAPGLGSLRPLSTRPLALPLPLGCLSWPPPHCPPSKNNKLEKIPPGAFSELSNLRELYLQNNYLTDEGLDNETFW